MNDEIIWPKGYTIFYRRIRDLADLLMNGSVLAIDPSSGGTSLPGFAVYEGGELQSSGVITFPKPKRDIYQRLAFLYDKVHAIMPLPPDILIIEEVHKSISGADLQYAIGVTTAAVRAPVTLQLPINVWKALAKTRPGYAKSDTADAELIGEAAILLAKEFAQ